jgi:hypothetical protein
MASRENVVITSFFLLTMNVMNISKTLWLLWVTALIFLIACMLYPVSYRITRLASLILLFTVWFGLIGLLWKKPWFRWSLVTVTTFFGSFLALPARPLPPSEELRSHYLHALQRYEGVTYYWGGESFRGIDCSGLIRRGLIDSFFLTGLKNGDPGLVRRAMSLWWHDCTAKALSEQHRGLTRSLFDTISLNDLDHTTVLPGDLAITSNGVHILAYIGNKRWIQADPHAGRVISLSAPSSENPWFNDPMKICRWTIF